MERGLVVIESCRLGRVHLDQISLQSWSNYSMLLRPCLARFCLLTKVETLFHCNLFWCLITLMTVGGRREPTNQKTSNDQETTKTSHFPCQNFSVFHLFSIFSYPNSLYLWEELCFTFTRTFHSVGEGSKVFPLHALCKLNKHSSQPHLIVRSSPLTIVVTPLMVRLN